MSFRGVGLDAFGGVEPHAGMVFTDPGFLSTSLLDQDTGFLDEAEVRMNIKVPKGTRAHYLDGLSRHPEERELLLASGARLRFTRVHKPTEPENGEQWIIDAEVVLPDGK